MSSLAEIPTRGPQAYLSWFCEPQDPLFSSECAYVEQQCVGRQLFLGVYKGSELWACDKKLSQAPPHPPRQSCCFVSTLVFRMLAWPAASHPASSSSTAPTQTPAELSVERSVAACTV